MLIHRLELEKTINVFIADYRRDKEIINNIEEQLYNLNIPFGMKLLTGQLPLQIQSIEVLYLLSKFFYMYTHEEEIKPSKFFTDTEMAIFKDMKFEDETEEDKQIIFKNFIQAAEDVWVGSMDIKDIAKLWERGVATYNKETQRNTILTKFQGNLIDEISLNKSSVNEITKAIKEVSYYPVSPIIFNILRDGNYDFEFNNGDLIYYSGDLNCTDGFHRSMAILNVLLELPHLNLNFPITITNFDVTKAKHMIAQEEKKNVMDKDYTKTLEDTYANSIVRELNARKGDMQGKIASNFSEIKYHKAYTTHNILTMAIEENFKIESNRDVRKISDFLIKGFNEIIGKYIDEFKDIETNQKSNITTQSIIFIGYVALLAKLYGQDDWIDKLENTLGKINFDKHNEKWTELGIFMEHSKLNKKRTRAISKYFQELIK